MDGGLDGNQLSIRTCSQSDDRMRSHGFHRAGSQVDPMQSEVIPYPDRPFDGGSGDTASPHRRGERVLGDDESAFGRDNTNPAGGDEDDLPMIGGRHGIQNRIRALPAGSFVVSAAPLTEKMPFDSAPVGHPTGWPDAVQQTGSCSEVTFFQGASREADVRDVAVDLELGPAIGIRAPSVFLMICEEDPRHQKGSEKQQ